MNLFWTIIIGILVFCVIIIIHEMGHFFVAKACGMKVYEFSLGMGPTLLKKKGKETVYSIKLLPIGGSVQLGEDMEADDNPRAFRNKPVWQRMLVIVAGAIMNLVLGMIVCIISAAASDTITTTTIRGFYENASTSSYLQAGDEIVSINNMAVWTTMDISYQLQNSVAKSDETQDILYFDFQVNRNGEILSFSDVPFKKSTTMNAVITLSDASKLDALKTLLDGIDKKAIPFSYKEGNVNDNSATLICTFKNYGEKLIAENTETIKNMLSENGINAQIGELYGKSESIFLDFHVQFYSNTSQVAEHGIGVLDVLSTAAKNFASEARLIWVTLFDLINGTYGINDLSGPIGIVETIGTVASTMDLSSLFMMISFLTINVGIFNLLPIPALDGARFVFLLIEAIRRKPIKAEVEGMIHFVGLMLLMLLMLVVTFNDIKRIFFGG